jgi:arylsulfatase A-like enzyme
MTESDGQDDQDAGRSYGRVDRRTFIAGGLLAGGALTAATLGVDAVSAADSQPVRGRAPGPYRATKQPNILVVMVDQLRAPRWFGPGARGAALPPNIAALARSGVSFTRHYTASNDCTPARATMLTGLHTHQTGVMITGASTLDPGFPTWGTMLRDQGYQTYWYGKWHLTHDDRRWNARSGPPGLARYGFDGGTFPSPNGAPGQGWRVDPHITRQFEHWLEQAGGDGPWCTTVSFVNPHDIAWWWRWSGHSVHEASAPSTITALPPNFETPEQLAARGKPLVQRSLQLTSAESFGEVPFSGPDFQSAWLPFLDLYVKLQLEVDRHVGQVMRALAARRRIAANTIVIFTSDHGEYGASHGLRGKGAGLYEEGIRVPLIVSDRRGRLGGAPGSLRHQLTSSVDFAPLLLTLAAGSSSWREDSRYAHLARRADIAEIVRDPSAPGRRYALHATDEVLTEFALLPHDAQAPLHVKGIVTPTAKYGVYSNWRDGTLEPRSRGEQHELYDYSTAGGQSEIDNVAGRSPLQEHLHELLATATREELQEPLPANLADARERGLAYYHLLARQAREGSEIHRLRAVERIVRGIEHQLP